MAKDIQPNTDFFQAQKYIYEPLSWKCDNFKKELEGKEYAASTFELNGKRIIFRAGKITPTKIGQFVTFWKRSEKGPIIPYDIQDNFDFIVVAVSSNDRLGQFVFPKEVLSEKGILSQDGKGGKLAIRVYPIWDIAENAQAKRTQKWQLKYFFEVTKELDKDRIKKLYFFK
jgi:hypothetical protein